MLAHSTVSKRIMADEVFLEGMRFYAYHGHNPEERVRGQRFVVDVRIGADLQEAGGDDHLEFFEEGEERGRQFVGVLGTDDLSAGVLGNAAGDAEFFFVETAQPA